MDGSKTRTQAAGAPYRVHGVLLHVATSRLPTVHGEFTVDRCQNLATRGYALALSVGDVRGPAPLLARVHSSCVTSEAFGSCDCDCAEQLDAALAHVARAGRGVVFYLMQEGRGAGFVAKVRDRMIVQASRNAITTFEAYERMGLGTDCRSYEEVASLRALLGITAPLEVLTNNPEKLTALAAAGVPIAGTVPLRHAPSPFNSHYLDAKLRSGHALNGADGAARPAELPEEVRYFEPHALAGALHLVSVASYLVPIVVRGAEGNGEGPHWFRLHAYFDLETNRERVVLTYAAKPGAVPLVRVQRESLLDRFPVRDGGEHKRAWHATIRAIVAHGAGCVVFVDDESRVDEPALWLLAHHAPKARPLLDAPDGTVFADALARLGVTTGPPVFLAGA